MLDDVLAFWGTEAVLAAWLLALTVAAMLMAAGKWNPSKAIGRRFGVAMILSFDVLLYYWIWRMYRG